MTNSTLGFIIHESNASNEMVVCVLGLKEVTPDIPVLDSENFWYKIKNANCPVLISNFDNFPEKLRKEIADYLLQYYNEEFDGAVIFPIFVGGVTEPSFYYCLVNCGPSTAISPNYGLINESFRYCGTLIITTFAYNEEMCHVKACKAVVETCVESLPYLDSLKSFWEAFRKELSQALNTEETTVYFFKHINDYSTTVIDFDYSPSNPEHDASDIFPYQFGLEGKMLKQGKFVNSVKPRSHQLLARYLKKLPKTKLRNVLSFPLLHKGCTNGIIEVFNKQNSEVKFPKADEEYAKCISLIGGTFISQAFKFSMTKDRQERYTYVNCQNLRRIPGDKACGAERILNCQDPHNYRFLLQFTFVPSSVPKEHTICVLMAMFHEVGVIKTFEINEFNMICFIQTLQLGYFNHPFHNWEHAFSTAHFLFVLVKNYSLLQNGFVDRLEILAFLTAAICHDIDFRGTTTPFQLTTGTSLGSLYGSPGKIKQHHAISQTLQILCRPQCNVAENMTTNQFKVFIRLLEEYVIDLDMTSFVRNLDQLNLMTEVELYSKTNPEHKKLFNILIMTAAHLSEYVKCKEYLDVVTKHQIDEFFRPEKAGIYRGVFDMGDLVHTPIKIVSLHVQFMVMIAVPAFELLYSLFPTTYNCLAQVIKNTNNWKMELERYAKPGARITPTESLISSLSEDEDEVDNNLFFK
ncbi:cGMP-dependent 3',5'-cyclic phosphodiesterase-like isoform X2 [Cimex lectularius]|nr:cGMP-dependent 3',5'-cyclic phosphodiesterase-like isoform X2 [Cimex lectularius]